MRRVLAFGLLTLSAPALALAQAPAPAAQATPAPRAARETVTAQIGGHKVSVEYGRPALRGRALADLLGQLGPDRMWRAGVDQATTFTTPVDLMIGEARVPAGKYTVYLHAPASGAYSLVLNSDPGVALKTIFPQAPAELADALWPRPSYAEIASREVARIPLTSAKAVAPMDRFLVAMEPAVNGVSALTLTWGDQSWTTGVRLAPKK